MVLTGKFREYLEEAIGKDNARIAFSAFDMPSSVSVRMNPFKPCRGFSGKPVPWNSYGVTLPDRPVFTLDPLFHAGAYYVQDSSSMFVGHVFRRVMSSGELPSGRPVRVLDLCAAPGGKTTDIAASLREIAGEDFLIVANEVIRSRAGVLAGNVALWGDPNVVVTSDDPRRISSLQGFFDVIVADVPCSGEGMFRKDAQAVEQWSEDNVAMCQARQRRIIADVWPCLAPGGILIYSTCTFNRMENDGNVEWIESSLGAECIFTDALYDASDGLVRTSRGCSLVPGLVDGEGQYCSVLRKTGPRQGHDSERSALPSGKRVRPKWEFNAPGSVRKLVGASCVFRMRGESVVAVPAGIAADVAYAGEVLHIIAAGSAVGTLKGNVLVPDADLALSLLFDRSAFPCVEVGRDVALAYLHRDAVAFPDAEKGYLAILYEGLPLGFVKNLGNRCNSLHPQGRRIRMDIKISENDL